MYLHIQVVMSFGAWCPCCDIYEIIFHSGNSPHYEFKWTIRDENAFPLSFMKEMPHITLLWLGLGYLIFPWEGIEISKYYLQKLGIPEWLTVSLTRQFETRSFVLLHLLQCFKKGLTSEEAQVRSELNLRPRPRKPCKAGRKSEANARVVQLLLRWN